MATNWDPFEQMKKTFGINGLYRANVEAVFPLCIPERSKQFLTKIGLPKEEILLCQFFLDVERFPSIEEFARSNGEVINSQLLLKRIGTDYGTQICLSEVGSSGQVVSFDIKERYPERFINSSIELFGGFLALYVEKYVIYRGCSDEELNKHAKELSALLKEIDPDAFASSDTWWSVIMEQVADGLL